MHAFIYSLIHFNSNYASGSALGSEDSVGPKEGPTFMHIVLWLTEKSPNAGDLPHPYSTNVTNVPNTSFEAAFKAS